MEQSQQQWWRSNQTVPCSPGTTWPQPHRSGAGRQHLPCLCPQLPHRRNRATIPAMPSICVSGPHAASGRDHQMSYNTRAPSSARHTFTAGRKGVKGLEFPLSVDNYCCL